MLPASKHASLAAVVVVISTTLASTPTRADDDRAATPAAAAAPATTTPANPATTTSDGPLTVAVLDLRAGKGTEGVARALSALITTEIGSRPGWKAISRAELKQLLAHQADQRLLGCDDPACVADVGKLAQAKRVVFGSVDLADGGAAVLALTLVDASSSDGPVVLERVAYTWKSAVEDMVDLARPAVDRLVLGKAAQSLTGGVEVLAPAGATVVVDDKELGAAPLKPVTGLTIGPHRIEVRKPGYLPWGKDVAINANESQVVQADLVDETSVQPIYARWYVWGSALAGAVVIGGTAAAIGTYQYLSTPAKLVVGAPK